MYIFTLLNIFIIFLLWSINRSKPLRFTQWKIVLMALTIYSLFLYIYYDLAVADVSKSLIRSYVSKEVLYLPIVWIKKGLEIIITAFPMLQDNSQDCLEYANGQLSDCMMFIITLLVITLFFIIKVVSIFVGMLQVKLLKKEEVLEGRSKYFYRELDGKVVLKNQYVFVGSVSKVFGTLLLFFSLVVLFKDLDNFHWSPLLPLSAMLLLEIGFFLDGKRIDVVHGNIEAQKTGSETVLAFDKVYSQYLQTFEKVVLAHTIHKRQQSSSTVAPIELDTSFLEHAAQKRLKDGLSISSEYLHGIDKLFSWRAKSKKKPNVLFSNAYDEQYAPYLKLFFEFSHLENKRIIIPLLTELEKEKTIKWLNELINKEVYTVSECIGFDYDNKRNHILVDTLETMMNDTLLAEEMIDFHFIVILDLKNYMRKNHLYLNTFLNLYNVRTGKTPQILGFSNLPNELEPSFNLIFVGANDDTEEIKIRREEANNFYLIVINGDDEDKIQDILEINRGQYLGNEIPLAYFTTQSAGIKPIVVFSETSSLDEEMEALKNSIPNPSQFDAKSIRKIKSRYFNSISDEEKFFIVDDIGNLPQNIQKWRNYALSQDLFLVIVSAPYLFRDYFVHNIAVSVDENDFYTEILPKGGLSRQERAFMLLLALSSSKVKRDEIHIDVPVSRNNIADFISRHLEKIEVHPSYIRASVEKEFNGTDFVEKIFYSIPQKIYDPQIYYFTFVNTQYEELGICLEDDVYHKYNKGMRITLLGRVYLILDINLQDHTISVEFSATEKIPSYNIRKSVTLNSLNPTEYRAILDRKIDDIDMVVGYYALNYMVDFHDIAIINTNITTRFMNKTQRIYKNKESLSIRFTSKAHIKLEMMNAFKYIMQESFKVLFPRNHHLLSVVIEPNQTFLQDNRFGEDKHVFSLWILETSILNYHLLSTIIEEKYFIKILMLMEDFVNWHSEQEEDISYVYSQEIEMKNMDFKALSLFLSQLLQGRNEIRSNRLKGISTQMIDRTEANNYCDFCAAPLPVGQFERLDDGRERCESCKKSSSKYQNISPEQIMKDALRFLENEYGAHINRSVNVKIISSQKLHERLGATYKPTEQYDPRVIGLAIDDGISKTILIENEAPYFREVSVVIHELTHIWQYDNLNQRKMDDQLKILEGQAQYVELAYIEKYFPEQKQYVEMEKAREDVYGAGYHFVADLLSEKEMKNPFELYRKLYG